ncbi:hypothetical protein COU17_03160 [Candidatus Kaiserbacteria bacterium CG10_big_fil_rev_8_21_14_0_10_49_17]|uniref:Uncharacterized protein n=1 Tax=Candidatus Kaiserbacteria bacterium CG10_big_fil_rev_8_21_14_0_10_49_17 TaxID=1974609 RepID=A0A2M6WDQ3_9BACT|nr:MAG: hypothetical protein COU17_03160 [Candidatus Kaiserbacteria bacterium CG10_big_fil_rev_8_21_14_0_10_49_17]
MMVKNELNKGVSSKILKIGMWLVLVVAISFVGLIIYRIPFVAEEERTAEAIARIQSQHLALKDVTGENLPSAPDEKLVDATIEGIDANQNGIRDDVELAIFERYPNDIKIRAALLQYAMALQLELTEVFNSETWVAAVKLSGRGTGCVIDTAFDEFDDIKNQIKVADNLIAEVDSLTLNTDQRKNRKQSLKAYEAPYASGGKGNCDLAFK